VVKASQELAHNLFGFQTNQRKFIERLQQYDDQNTLLNVVTRVYLTDVLRHRLHFDYSGRLLTGELQILLADQLQALELYLLCTCVDVLSSEYPFVNFAQWFLIRDPESKARHGIDKSEEQQMAAILQDISGDLHDLETFRSTVAQLYQQVYLPKHGVRRNFVRYFLELPTALRKLLADVYVISTPLHPEELSPEVQPDEDLSNDIKTWHRELNAWSRENQKEKIKRIASYLYEHRRNPYTHRAYGKPPLVVEPWSEQFGKELGSQLEKRYRVLYVDGKQGGDGRKRIIAFKAVPGEDEALLLRLVVAIGWRVRLGYDVDAEYVQGFRTYQMRRESMYYAISEMKTVWEIVRYYDGEDEEHPIFSVMQRLPSFPMVKVEKLRDYLYTDTTLEGGIDSSIIAYLHCLVKLNELIEDFNMTYFPHWPAFPPTDPEARQAVQKARIEVYELVHNAGELQGVKKEEYDIYRWTDFLADWMTW